jgi:Flp pilus assembly pilin Flp
MSRRKGNETMKKEAKKQSVIQRAIRTLTCDKTGGVMMEYVILAVLVAAAVLVAVMLFGKNIKQGFNTSTQAVAGQSQKTAEDARTMKTDATKAETESEVHRRKISDK